MRRDPLDPRHWPDPAQRLLLDAAVREGADAAAAWERWSTENDLDHADPASVSLLPPIYKNLIRAGVPDAELQPVKDVYKYAWTRNQMTFNRMLEATSIFEQAGIDCLLLKGAALLLTTYDDLGSRMTYDVDLLIREEHRDEAIAALVAEGWEERTGMPLALRRFFHGLHVYAPDGVSIDLHFRSLFGDCDQAVGLKVWDRVTRVDWRGRDLLVPDATDLLLQACVDSRKMDEHAKCRWVVDAHLLMRDRSAELDWEELVQRAVDFEVVLPLRDTLEYLVRELDAPVPQHAVADLRSHETDPSLERRYRRMSRPETHVLNRTLAHWGHYDATCRWNGEKATIGGFARLLTMHYRWRLRWHSSSIPGRLGSGY